MLGIQDIRYSRWFLLKCQSNRLNKVLIYCTVRGLTLGDGGLKPPPSDSTYQDPFH